MQLRATVALPHDLIVHEGSYAANPELGWTKSDPARQRRVGSSRRRPSSSN